MDLGLLKGRRKLFALALTGAALGVMAFGLIGGATAGNDPTRPIRVNQTDGYGNDRLTAFTYYQNYQCIHEPFDDRDHNGAVAATDPNEFQAATAEVPLAGHFHGPICQVGFSTAPTLDPAGEPIRETEPLYVIVPFFDADNDGEAATPELRATLMALFGFVPDAFDPTPGVPVQCPEPGQPLTQHHGAFGTCTMHPSVLDLGPVLADLGKIPAGLNVSLPLPNHSHIIDGANFGAIWWQIKVVLVADPSLWPNVNGTMGLNSVKDMNAAIAAGKAIGPVPSNFFLFFDSREFRTR